MKDTFKPIPGFEGYSINEAGTVVKPEYVINQLSQVGGVMTRRVIKERVVKHRVSNMGYLTVKIYKYKSVETRFVHRLVALTYIPNPENKPQINHIDGDRLNCHASNLEWTTQSENMIHSLRVLRKRPNRAITCLQYNLDGAFIKSHESQYAAARELGLSDSKINACCKGRRNHHGGFKFSYDTN